MKKNFLSACLLSVLLLVIGNVNIIYAQFSNSWINHNQQYFKFGIVEEGIFRITKAQLDVIGFGNVPGSDFAIYREGQQIPIVTSTNGVFAAHDFIEFYGNKSNGKIDQKLYSDPAFQPNEDLNLLSDTAYYFITYSSGNNLRFQVNPNIIPTNPPSAAAFCWAEAIPTANFRGGR